MTICSLPATMPNTRWSLYSKNLQAVIELVLDENGALAPNYSDEILAAAYVTSGEAKP